MQLRNRVSITCRYLVEQGPAYRKRRGTALVACNWPKYEFSVPEFDDLQRAACTGVREPKLVLQVLAQIALFLALVSELEMSQSIVYAAQRRLNTTS
jgi:hypothetical protein